MRRLVKHCVVVSFVVLLAAGPLGAATVGIRAGSGDEPSPIQRILKVIQKLKRFLLVSPNDNDLNPPHP